MGFGSLSSAFSFLVYFLNMIELKIVREVNFLRWSSIGKLGENHKEV